MSHTSVPVIFLDRNQTCIGSFLPFMDTGPLCSKWNCGSEFSGVMRHLKGTGNRERSVEYGCTGKGTHTNVI